MLRASGLLAVCWSLCGCGGWLTAFNECNPDKGDVLGRTTVELDLRKVAVRSAEAPVGNLVVDALFDAALRSCNPSDPLNAAHPCPVAAVENAGGIRSATACGERTSIPIGNIHETDVTDMLPFATNQAVLVTVTGEELLLMLERSVSLLGQVGEAGAAGYFLQLHGIAMQVDCSRTAQQLDPKNERILQRGARVDPLLVTVGGAALDLGGSYVLAMNSFIAGAKDGFLGLAVRDAEDRVVKDESGAVRTKSKTFVQVGGARVSEADAVKSYIQHRDGQVVAPRVEGRIRLLESCIPTE